MTKGEATLTAGERAGAEGRGGRTGRGRGEQPKRNAVEARVGMSVGRKESGPVPGIQAPNDANADRHPSLGSGEPRAYTPLVPALGTRRGDQSHPTGTLPYSGGETSAELHVRACLQRCMTAPPHWCSAVPTLPSTSILCSDLETAATSDSPMGRRSGHTAPEAQSPLSEG